MTALYIAVGAIVGFMLGYLLYFDDAPAKRIRELINENERLRAGLKSALRNDSYRDPKTGKFAKRPA